MCALYVGIRNAEFVLAVAADVEAVSHLQSDDRAFRAALDEVGKAHGIPRATVKRYWKRARDLEEYTCALIGHGLHMPCGIVFAEGGTEAAARGLIRAYPDTFKRLDLPGWVLKVDRVEFDLHELTRPWRAA